MYLAYLYSEILRVFPTNVGIAIVVLAVLLRCAQSPLNLDSSAAVDDPADPRGGSYGRLFRNGRLMLAVVTEFLYGVRRLMYEAPYTLSEGLYDDRR